MRSFELALDLLDAAALYMELFAPAGSGGAGERTFGVLAVNRRRQLKRQR